MIEIKLKNGDLYYTYRIVLVDAEVGAVLEFRDKDNGKLCEIYTFDIEHIEYTAG